LGISFGTSEKVMADNMVKPIRYLCLSPRQYPFLAIG